MKKVFAEVEERREKMREFLRMRLSQKAEVEEVTEASTQQMKAMKTSIEVEGRSEIFPCKACGKGRVRIVISKKGFPFLGCSGFPECRNSAFFPRGLARVKVLEELCATCSGNLVELGFVAAVSERANEVLQGKAICLAGCDEEAYKGLIEIRFTDAPQNNWKKRNYKADKESSKGGSNKKSNRCPVCGITGRHPKGANCPGKRKKKAK
eukprot:TRINITY_DN9423_c0_g3_i3.p2 TRINITY_DN9423_c0_g3~~TRINITY_DN9423_c0_g3_i3.p2  ORF type:complete len:209 (+),score=57.52 TRINITY_DN9423_c0_g3_i3:924-1550(+)